MKDELNKIMYSIVDIIENHDIYVLTRPKFYGVYGLRVTTDEYLNI